MGWVGLASACSGGYVYDGQGGEAGAAQSSGTSGADSGAGTTTGTSTGTTTGTSTGTTTGTSTGTTAGTTTGTGTGTGTGSATGTAPACTPIADFFANKMWAPELKTTCATCHASVATFMLDPSKDVSVALAATEAEAKKLDSSGKSLLLAKPIGGDDHKGAAPLTSDSDVYKAITAFVTAVNAGKDCVTP